MRVALVISDRLNSAPGMDILFILLLILLNGALAMSEMAIVSVRRSRLQQLAEEGDKATLAALALADQPTYFFSTVQLGVSLISIILGVFGEAALSGHFKAWFATIPLLAPVAGALATVCMVALLTYVMMVLGELVPKRLGMMMPERIARLIARPMKAVFAIAHPLITVLSASTEFLLTALGIRKYEEPPVTEEEIKVLMAEGAEAGVFEASERDIVENVFRLDDWRVSLIMTTQADIEYLDLDLPWERQREVILAAGHTWLPVCQGGFAKVLGVLSLQDMLNQMLRGEAVDVPALLRPALFAPLSMSPLALLELFREKRQHMALVVNEYGDVQGLVTLKDLLETVLGEVNDDSSDDDPDIVHQPDGSLLLDGALSIERFRELYPLETEALEEANRDYQTVAGLVLYLLGHLPQSGETLHWRGLSIMVAGMDKQRIGKVLVRHDLGSTGQRQTPS